MFQRLSCSLFVLSAVACGVEAPASYSRQPLVAQAVPLNVLFLVDASGSMDTPINSMDPLCGGCGSGVECPSGCVTRWSLTQDLVTTVAGRVHGQARVGLGLFPTDATCGGPAALDEPLTSTPSLVALTSRRPMGGTPTAEALRLAAQLPSLLDPSADNVVVLVTDGLPNCNAAHPADACGGDLARCRCTLSSCTAASMCARGCLDDDATLAAAQALGARGIQLVTVTVGPEWATAGGLTLAGALGDVGVASNGCGANCQGLVLSVLSAADQVQAGQQLESRLTGCAWEVSDPVAAASLAVEVDHRPLSPADFTVAGQRVWLGAGACGRVRAGADLALFAR